MPKPVYLMTAGGSQGVQLLDGSNQDQVWAIRLRRVWDSWHPSIQSWSLWIGKSTCSYEPTLPETEPANSKGIIQAKVFKHWRCFSDQNYTRQAVWLGQLCSHRYVRITRLLSTPLILRIGDWLCLFCLQSPLYLTSPRKLTKLPTWTDW